MNLLSLGGARQLNKRRLVYAAMLLLAPIVLPSANLLQRIDSEFVDLRAKLAPRDASDRFVFIAIDKESLDHVGTWPWPRSVHAAIIDTLVEAGAGDIFLDIDFSTPSNPEEDRELASALEKAGGGVILPVFEQHQHVEDASAVAVTKPIEMLANNAWLAAANVTVDDAGRFLGFGTSLVLDGATLPVAPVLLAGGQELDRPVLSVDFSINPNTVKVMSVADLLRGEIDTNLLANRSVVVGAYATELKDQFSAPVYGILNGPMLHILAAETLLQGRVPRQLPVWPAGVMLAVAILGGLRLFRDRRVEAATATAIATSLSIEVVAYLLQKEWSLHLLSGTYHAMLVAGLAILLFEKLGVAGWLLEVASAERRNSRRILKRVISDSSDAVIIVNGDGRIVELSRAAVTLFEIGRGLKRGDELRQVLPAELVQVLDRLVEGLNADEKLHPAVREEIKLIRTGQPLHLEAVVTISRFEERGLKDQIEHSSATCITLRDITDRKSYEAKLRRLSQRDDLTGALNRREFVTRLAQSTQEGVTMAVVAVDLHRFAAVNASFGRTAGDQLLVTVARRLMGGAHDISRDTGHTLVSRLGGDVFCIGVAVSAEEDIAALPEAVISLFSNPLDAGGIRLHVDVRVGACLATNTGNAAASVDAAELALDQAKKIGGSGWHIYDPVAALQQARRMRLEQEMRPALRDSQFFLLYQPQVALDSGAVLGAEALMRWNHPDLGLVSPLDFIEVAESNGFICELGRWALLQACSAASSWASHLSVAVNVSAVQFAKADLCADVRDALAASGLEPHRLHLEVTETAFLLDPERLLRQVTDLRSLGVAIALDDFGTGYSSLGYIARFPFDKIKIDQCFVRGLLDSPANQAIVRSVQSLANGVGMVTVCEGIEDEAEWQMLKSFGCQQGQGYLFGKPQTADDLLAFVSEMNGAGRRSA